MFFREAKIPAIRSCYLTHPTLAVPGLWLELSTSPPGTLTGLARTAFPSTAGKTLAQYTVTLNTAFRDLCSLEGIAGMFGVLPPGWYIGGDGKWYPKVVDVVITLSSLSPITISDVTVNEGAVRSFKVGG